MTKTPLKTNPLAIADHEVWLEYSAGVPGDDGVASYIKIMSKPVSKAGPVLCEMIITNDGLLQRVSQGNLRHSDPFADATRKAAELEGEDSCHSEN